MENNQKIPRILSRVTAALAGTGGLEAIVLGGSHAAENAREGSDLDIGLYYRGTLDVSLLNRKAAALDDRGQEGLVTQVGEWGPWINGGGWLVVDGMHVDLLFRDLDKAARVADECRRGVVTLHYQCGHPFAFVNAIYLGELQLCRILWEKSGAVTALKRETAGFSPQYRRAAVEKFLWEAGFSLSCGRSSVRKGDLLYGSGSLFRAANCLIQALYALNRNYVLNEKGSLERLCRLPGVWLPPGFARDLNRAMEGLSLPSLPDSFALLEKQRENVEEYWQQEKKKLDIP